MTVLKTGVLDERAGNFNTVMVVTRSRHPHHLTYNNAKAITLMNVAITCGIAKHL